MEHNPVSMGDIAYAAASGNSDSIAALSRQIRDLKEEVDALRSTVFDQDEIITNAINHLADFVGYPGA